MGIFSGISILNRRTEPTILQLSKTYTRKLRTYSFLEKKINHHLECWRREFDVLDLPHFRLRKMWESSRGLIIIVQL